MTTTCGKFQYSDKKAALTAANFRQHRNYGHHRQRRGKVKRLRACCCPDCGGWHLTSKP